MNLIETPDLFGATDVGMKRTDNEDSFIAEILPDGERILCAAIDGIGGYEGGEIAAAIARDTILKKMLDTSEKDLASLKEAVAEANNEIIRAKNESPERNRMGCVATAALINTRRHTLSMVHVGDSRLYMFRDGQLTKLSRDHSLVGYREEIGDLSEEEAMNHPQRNLIERSLGETIHTPDDPNFLDAAIFPIEGDTQFLLCSDGLSDMITSRQIAEILSTADSSATKVGHLIAAANQAGGKDNITAVLIRLRYRVSDETYNDISHNRTPAPLKSEVSTSLVKKIGCGAVLLAVGATAGYFTGYLPGNAAVSEAIRQRDSVSAILDATKAERDNLLDSISRLSRPADTNSNPDTTDE